MTPLPMSPLLEQFLSEAREFLEGIGQKLMQLEDSPGDAVLLNELFRLVHTLKGNSGLFTFPEMTRVLHAGEDLLVQVRTGDIVFSQELADRLLDAMDFVGLLCDEIESGESADAPQAAAHAAQAVLLAEALRALMPINPAAEDLLANSPSRAAREESATGAGLISGPGSAAGLESGPRTILLPLADIPEAVRMEVFRQSQDGEPLHWVAFTPDAGCFFQGDDPFHTARQTPGVKWGRIVARETLPPIMDLDTYRCVLDFHLLSTASRQELAEHYRYVPDQIRIVAVDRVWLVIPHGLSPANSTEGVVGNGLGRDTGADEFIADALPLLWAGDLAALKQNAQDLLVLSDNDSWIASGLRWLMLLLDCIPDNRRALGLLIESLGSFTPPDWLAGISSPGPVHAGSSETARLLPEPVQSKSSSRSDSLCEEDTVVLEQIFAAQRQILVLEDRPAWQAGRLQAVARVLTNGFKAAGDVLAENEVEAALANALADGQSAPLLAWFDANQNRLTSDPMPSTVSGPIARAVEHSDSSARREAEGNKENAAVAKAPSPEDSLAPAPLDDSPKFGRRVEDLASPKSLKVDQVKIDRLMNLIGEMVVAKNALPYLAQRAENQFGVRELAREIKAQYSIINRISDEMQDSIMQVRMMAVSFVFQRFPRLARDISRKLGKKVQLVLEGEETAADKNIIEALADPLIHIVRNSLDHGLETPEVRVASGKPATGTLTIRALQEADRVLIEIIDDGKGIDPALMKRKAYEKGVIDEATLERISDQDAVNLIFAAGFSTAETISDLSGRGVGMDVVRSAVQKVNGTVQVESVVGKGTSVRISLPLSMAVTQVMIVESDGQLFGVPMDHVVETVRIPRSSVHTIKRSQTAVLRGRVVPLKSLNTLLGLVAEPKVNADDELAVLLVQANGEELGILVDGFRETTGTIQKPLGGVLSGLSAYSGSALMGDGSVLMVLNVKEMV
jgi:two-component system, chemotaxis family, sensor kinase CheA